MSAPSSPSNPSGQRALARFPAAVQADHASYLANGDIAAAERVLLAVLRDHLPSRARAGDAPLRDDARLIEDLGFDSLAIAEVVFFLEDLYQVRIPQEQLQQLRLVGDLRGYLRDRLRAVQV